MKKPSWLSVSSQSHNIIRNPKSTHPIEVGEAGDAECCSQLEQAGQQGARQGDLPGVHEGHQAAQLRPASPEHHDHRLLARRQFLDNTIIYFSFK